MIKEKTDPVELQNHDPFRSRLEFQNRDPGWSKWEMQKRDPFKRSGWCKTVILLGASETESCKTLIVLRAAGV